MTNWLICTRCKVRHELRDGEAFKATCPCGGLRMIENEKGEQVRMIENEKGEQVYPWMSYWPVPTNTPS